MHYCVTCQRHLNGALVCPGCGTSAPWTAPVAPAGEPDDTGHAADPPAYDGHHGDDGHEGHEGHEGHGSYGGYGGYGEGHHGHHAYAPAGGQPGYPDDTYDTRPFVTDDGHTGPYAAPYTADYAADPYPAPDPYPEADPLDGYVHDDGDADMYAAPVGDAPAGGHGPESASIGAYDLAGDEEPVPAQGGGKRHALVRRTGRRYLTATLLGVTVLGLAVAEVGDVAMPAFVPDLDPEEDPRAGGSPEPSGDEGDAGNGEDTGPDGGTDGSAALPPAPGGTAEATGDEERDEESPDEDERRDGEEDDPSLIDIRRRRRRG
ncbi:SCO2400 family protein [Streptomyces specialis]|uniref:SCO2400 family protein n=1 Tax=Streptomyces specialis TaxID=498367 RepID=UPI00073ED72F|nr:hypothetical protein [Streptomyces specialis]